MQFNQTLECFYCGKMSTVEQIDMHHVLRRSERPDLIDDETNKMPLCRTDHERATNNKDFENHLKVLWTKQQSSQRC